MEFISTALGFIGGISLALITALINLKLSNEKEAKKELESAEYNLYIKLNDLYNWYFWLATNELHKKETNEDVTDTIHKIAIDIAELLHKNETSEFAEELLKILYDESYVTYDERWKQMAELSDKMGYKVVPKHQKYLKELSNSNILLMASSTFVSKAPASSRFKYRV